ncbi:MAG TPA: class I SAM-dependent methyltransferase [Candidatus Gracilibacteria bacterium]|nr:class I SAM-dependent methyltransferase [Candidatus Gracilibacteria bacterium]
MKEKTKKEILISVKKTYNSIAEDFSETRKMHWHEFEDFLKYIKNNDTIVDLGCGNGRLYSFIKGKRKVKYIGIDNSKKLITEAKKLTKGKFIEGDLLKIPAKTASTKVVACIAAFHHLPSKELREKSLKEMHRILEKNGKLILTVWNLLEQPKYKKKVKEACFKWLTTLGKYEKRGLQIPWGNKKIPRYYYAFKQKEIEKLLKKYFKIIEKKVDKNLIYICEKV